MLALNAMMAAVSTFLFVLVATLAACSLSVSQGTFTRRTSNPTVIFCTSELEHFTSGGAGVVVADSARSLSLGGWRVLIVLDVVGDAQAALDTWRQRAIQTWGPASKPFKLDIELFLLSDLAKHAGFQHRAMNLMIWHKSEQWARAIKQIAGHIDAIEFWDCGAPAYHTLLWRLMDTRRYSSAAPGTNSSSPQIWIRTHGLHQAIVGGEDIALTSLFSMEKRALQLADAVIANSPGVAREYQTKHNLDPGRIAVIPPTLGTLATYDDPHRVFQHLSHDSTKTRSSIGAHTSILPKITDQKNILVYGKLARVKGPDIAAKAIVRVMRELSSSWSGSVVFAGDDVPCDIEPAIKMSTCILLSDVPPDFRHRFRFVGRVRRGALGSFAEEQRIAFVILPSRYETFCLAAHDAANFGLPVVLPRLPAYEGFFHDRQNALMFDGGSADDLARVCEMALSEGDLLRGIAGKHLRYPNPLIGYHQLVAW